MSGTDDFGRRLRPRCAGWIGVVTGKPLFGTIVGLCPFARGHVGVG
jgi:hypothetical protein